MSSKTFFWTATLLLCYQNAYSHSCDKPLPIHLDDIHLIVSEEAKAVSFFEDSLGAREMAHPGERFDLVRFMSIKWHDPTFTLTRKGPYEDLPASRNQRWLDARIIDAQHQIFYGAKWVALAVPRIDQARTNLVSQGFSIFEDAISLPLEPNAKAFKILGPDNTEFVIVERQSKDFGDSTFSVDHIQFLASSAKETSQFFQQAFGANVTKHQLHSIALQVADVTLIVSEPEALGIERDTVSPFEVEQTIRLGFDHLGFLYEDIGCAVKTARSNGVEPLFPATRYIYKGKPTIYTFTAFQTPDGFNIEMVQADGRIGPHSYYDTR